MALKANYEFLFFGKDDNSFLENYYYDLFQDLGDKSGQIFLNLEVQNNPVDAEEIGGVIFETMQKVFFEDVERDPYERFEVALKEINKVLNDFKGQKFSGYIGNLNVIIAAVVGDVLYLTQAGDAEAYLIRKKYVSVVSEGLNDEGGVENEIFSSIASGKIEAGDFVLFGNTRLLRYVAKNDLAGCITRRSVVQSLESIKDAVSAEFLGRIGLTGILFEEAEKDELKTIETESDVSTKSMLESNLGATVSRKEALVGKFFTALKGLKRGRRSEIFQGRGDGFLNIVGGWLKIFWRGLFSKGFGRDKILALLVVLILVLTAGIWIARSNSATRAQIQQLDEILQGVQGKVAEAETKGTYDKEAAKTILDQAYEDAMTVLNSGYYREKAKIYLVEIDKVRDTLDNVERIENPTVLADLSTKRADVNALGLVEVGDRLFAYEYNALYEIVLDQVQDPLTIDDNEKVIAATGFDDRGSVVFLTESGKLIEYRGGTMSFMDTDDGTFHKGVAINDWSNRIYLLDAVEGQIWRYTYRGTQEKFGAAETYLADTDAVDLKNARDLAIDSNVYVLGGSGDLIKLYGGSKVEMFINNAPFNVFKDPAIVYTNEKINDVYVLDSKASRVLVFAKNSKTGNLDYKSQYLIDGVGELRDLYVDIKGNKLLLLTSSKILEINLNTASA